MLATSSLASFGYLCLPRNVSISSIFLLAWICSWYSLAILFTSVESIMMSLPHSWLEICVFSLFFPWSVWLEFYQFYRYSQRSIENIELWFCGFFSPFFFFSVFWFVDFFSEFYFLSSACFRIPWLFFL